MSARRKPAGDPTTEFFGGLVEDGRNPLLEGTNGTVRFELRDGKRVKRWLVSLEDGEVTVSRANGDADCVVRADKALFDEIAIGKTNATAAVLRGALTMDGEMKLMVALQRVFPGPPARRRRNRNGRRPA